MLQFYSVLKHRIGHTYIHTYIHIYQYVLLGTYKHRIGRGLFICTMLCICHEICSWGYFTLPPPSPAFLLFFFFFNSIVQALLATPYYIYFYSVLKVLTISCFVLFLVKTNVSSLFTRPFFQESAVLSSLFCVHIK